MIYSRIKYRGICPVWTPFFLNGRVCDSYGFLSILKYCVENARKVQWHLPPSWGRLQSEAEGLTLHAFKFQHSQGLAGWLAFGMLFCFRFLCHHENWGSKDLPFMLLGKWIRHGGLLWPSVIIGVMKEMGNMAGFLKLSGWYPIITEQQDWFVICEKLNKMMIKLLLLSRR